MKKFEREILMKQGTEEEGYLHMEHGRVWYRIVGTDKKEAPILCVHGGPGVPHDYLIPMENMAIDRPVIFYDQLGCGNSDRPDAPELWTKEFFADELDNVREGLGLDEMYLLGQSWGTMLAAYYMIYHTQKGIKGSILAGPLFNSEMQMVDVKALMAKMSKKSQEVFHAYEAGEPCSQEDLDAVFSEFNHKHICRLDPWPDCVNACYEKEGHQVYNAMWGPGEVFCTGNLRDFDVTPRMNEIKVPVLFICGEHDEQRPVTVWKHHMLVPNSKFVVMEDCSHMQHVEKPEEFRDIVLNWISQYAP